MGTVGLHIRPFPADSLLLEVITADAVRQYQLHRRTQGAEAATINREPPALSWMFELAIRRGLLERMPLSRIDWRRIPRGTVSLNTMST